MIVFLNSKPCPRSSLKCDASLRRRERHEICNTCSCSSPYQTIGQLSRKVCQRSYMRPSLGPHVQSVRSLGHCMPVEHFVAICVPLCWPSPTNVAKVRSPTESNCSSLHVLCRFGNSLPSWHRRFTLYIFDFALAGKNSLAHFWALGMVIFHF